MARTGEAAAMLAEAVQADIDAILASLTAAVAGMRELADDGRLVPGLETLMRAQSSQVELTIGVLKEERADAQRAILREPPEVAATVNASQLDRVRRAKEPPR